MNKKRIICFLEGRKVPASRFRVVQFTDKLCSENDMVVRNLTTVPSKYLFAPAWLRSSPIYPLWAAFLLLLVVFQRFIQILLFVPSATHIIFQRDLLYRVPVPFLERMVFLLASRRARKIFDVDDAIHLGKKGREDRIEQKLLSIVKQVDIVLAGNEYLANFYKSSARVEVVPTVIDMQRFSETRRDDNIQQPPTLGWTGVSSNLAELASLTAVLNEVYEKHPFQFKILTNAGASSPFTGGVFPVELCEWRPENEFDFLYTLQIGLMPLKDTPWNAGKCGFKLLQYMASGMAAVASPVGVNRSIVEHGVNGFHASTESEWRDAVSALLESSQLRKEMGRCARATVEEKYSLQRWYPEWREFVIS